MFEQDKCCSRMCTAVCCNEVAARWILKVQNHLLVREKVASWFLWPMRPKIDKMLHQPLSPLMLCTASKKILQNNLNPKLIYACFFKEHFHISCDHKMFSVFISFLLYLLDTTFHWMFPLKVSPLHPGGDIHGTALSSLQYPVKCLHRWWHTFT